MVDLGQERKARKMFINKMPRYEILSEESMATLTAGWKRIVSEIGIEFASPWAVEVLKEIGVYGKLAIVGIAKRLEEIYYPDDPLPLYIDKKSETLKVIQQMRDEAHRFGITHHRARRSKGIIKTSLTDIPGVGEETARMLLKTFRSAKRVREATEEMLTEVVGKAKATQIKQYFDQENKANEAHESE